MARTTAAAGTARERGVTRCYDTELEKYNSGRGLSILMVGLRPERLEMKLKMTEQDCEKGALEPANVVTAL
jgi:hypothetical protein